ncbi:hypothetical protein QIT30_gp06 [Saccharolobus solfataricus rod-shaped virus 1]|uniref:PHA01746-like domain-containing protein n=1 Tax=Saccharolobus solfataricus rod-shaped virus 1 TaxID=2730619 RepID=A0A6M3VYF7_SSRV1|nr:hypothetical protein QIT30_gp06 [Saccharolobus solfataricus rod-shaped virus 1]QJF12282.1 hypothetical protein SSRV1_gp06 [Saccharolobus solfataricus rod-shaped virus 1]
MATLEEIFAELRDKAKESGKPATRVLKIKGLKRLVVQLNAVPSGNNVRFSMTVHSSRNYKKQIGIVANDANDFEIISKFLQKHKDLLDKYVKFSARREENEVEVDIGEDTEEPKKEKKKRNVEEEF